MRKFSFLVLAVSFFIVFMVNLYAEFEKKAIADGVLRLHVVAESNSKRDQELKLKVRDAVLVSAKELFSDVKNKEEAIAVAKENTEFIKKAADIFDIVCPDGEYGDYRKTSAYLYLYLSTMQWRNGKHDKAFQRDDP